MKNGKPRNSIIYVENGEIEYTFLKTNKVNLYDKGSIIFIPSKYPYSAKYMNDNTTLKVLTFSADSENTLNVLKSPLCTKNSNIIKIIQSVNQENGNNPLFLTSKIYEIIYILSKKETDVPEKFKKIIPALEEIRAKYFENKKISYYSDLCYMSESNFRKLFREYMGKSFVEYRNTIRIHEAKKLIESNECTVSEAAYITAFNNMSFFYECMKKYE